MLKFKKSALSVLILALSTSASTSALASDTDFTTWLKSQKEVQIESLSTSSDQLIVKYKSEIETATVGPFGDSKIIQRTRKRKHGLCRRRHEG